MLKIAIVGRPNVGKSTLFNRLTGRNLALISEQAGTTMDFREHKASIAEIEFLLTDMAGVELSDKGDLSEKINEQIVNCINETDLVFLLFDVSVGITGEDIQFAKTLKKTKKPIILIGNKSESKERALNVFEGWNLGLGKPIAFSAAHGQGINELYESIKEFLILKNKSNFGQELIESSINEDIKNSHMKITFVGRPNTGKSTLVNNILGYDRMLTGPKSGITHDAIETELNWKGIPFQLIDTAGMRRKSKIFEELEYKTIGDSLRAIKFTNIAVLMLDGREKLNKQDLAIARWVIEEGRALIICINMWDVVNEKEVVFNLLKSRLERSLPQIKGVSVLKISGLLGNGVNQLMVESKKVYEVWNKRITTNVLNKWLENVTEFHPPPMAKGRRIKLLYISQVKTRPPSFVIFSNQPSYLPISYLRYLTSKLREDFNLTSVPIRLMTRKKDNPYIN